MKLETLCIHGAKDPCNTSGAISVPIYQSATFGHPGVGVSTGYDYSRVHNPTRESLEKQVAALEGGTDALAFTSGMAAIAALMELFSPGDHIIACDDLYGGTTRLFDSISRKNGLMVEYVDARDVGGVTAKIGRRTRAVFIETPTNPLMRVTDIAAVRKAIGPDILLVVDNTFLTPYFQRPIGLGADVVVHSGTKYLGGHNDTLAGFLVTARTSLADRLRHVFKTTGAGLAPFDCFLIIRGLKTLALRMEKSQGNAIQVAHWLLKHPKVRAVHYPGLHRHPDYAVSKKQAGGFGAMISFEVDCVETAHRVLEGLDMILYAESLGGVETLITYPLMQTHADVPEEKRAHLGISDCLLRLSVGIEALDDIVADLGRAFGKSLESGRA